MNYGNPSGHSSFSSAILLVIFLDLKDSITTQLWQKIGLAVATVAVFLTIGYSRLFLGVHSINQVSWGLQLGIWFAFSMHYIVRDQLMASVKRIINGQNEFSITFYAVVCTVAMLVLLAVQKGIYIYSIHSYENPQEWSDQIGAKCGKQALTNAFQQKGLIAIGESCFIFGAFYGFVVSMAHSPRLISGEVIEDTWLRFSLRMVLALSITIPLRYIPGVVKSTSLSPVTILFLGSVIPSVLQGFSLFYVADFLNSKFGLLTMKQ